MDLSLKEEDLTFRDEVRQFLRQNLTPDLGSIRRSSHAIGDQSAMMIGPDYASTPTACYLNDRAASIYAGSNQVQRNILAAHVLGL